MSMKDFVGQTLGQYRIEAPLNVGGMGQVFRGTHMYLNRPAAIKVMHPHLATDQTFRERFLQEARAAGALTHPNIVSTYEFGEQDGQLYLAMELMTAGSLRTLLYRRTANQLWSLPLGLDLIRQAAEGLNAAHAQKVVHRDIKPDNLLLNKLNNEKEEYQLKISDFGLARLAEGTHLTATGVPMGTLAYMSPEQCLGQATDGRSDLYSLGVVLYEVATGYQPFKVRTFFEAIEKHVKTEPPSPRQLKPDLSSFVEEIILRCLAKKPEDRYQTGGELARDLQSALTTAPVLTMPAFRIPDAEPPEDELKTNMRTPSVVPRSAPNVSPLTDYSSIPRVRVINQEGNTLQIVEILPKGLIIGRQSGKADLVLPSSEISRQHVRIVWDGQQVTVQDLGSSNGTTLGKTKLQQQMIQVWPEELLLRIGPYWLRLEANASTRNATNASFPHGQVPLHPSVFGSNYSQRTPVFLSTVKGGSERIGVTIDPKVCSITPGQPTTTRVTIANRGSIVDWFTITVEGAFQDWVQGLNTTVQLNPGMQETVELTINVPRYFANRAREYPIVIRARSHEKNDEVGLARARWTILPFNQDSLQLEPRRASGRGHATYTIVLHNEGNEPHHYELAGDDDEQKIDYHFRQPSLALEPGQKERIPFTVNTNRRWIGHEQRQPFQIHAMVRDNNTRLSKSAEFVNKTLLPLWVIPTFVAIVVSGAVVFSSLSGVFSKSSPPPQTTITLPGSQTPLSNSSLTHVTTPAATVQPSPTTIPTVTPPPTVPPPPTGPVAPPAGPPTAAVTPDQTAQAIQAIQDMYNNITNNNTPTIDEPMDTNSGVWPVGDTSDGDCEFSNGYQITDHVPGTYWNCFRNGNGGTNFSNFLYQAEVRTQANDGGGITFRATDHGYYLFYTRASGEYGLYGPSGTLLTQSSSSYVNQGTDALNSLAVMVQGDEIDMFINRQYVATIHDSSSTNGIIGVSGYQASFSNIEVWQL